MRFEDFVAGRYVQQYQYRSFSPAPVNQEWTWEDPRIHTLLEQAAAALAELNAFSLIVPDIDRFISMHVVKEANTSSRIEGTRTEMQDVLLDEEFVADEKKDDRQEVRNYIEAMNAAIADLKTLPLSTRLLRRTHGILLRGVRGKHKTPGDFRRSQNWIGGTSLQDAVFVPPHQDEVGSLMGDLERFWHNEAVNVPHLIRIAISHYQFETIHPFLDGNGRIGRLLITLYLIDKGLLKNPSLYLSAYIERYKGRYYDALTVVRASNDLGQWVRFFLVAVRETAQRGVRTFQAIMQLRKEAEARVMSLGGKAPNGMRLLEQLYRFPAMTIQQAAALNSLSIPTAGALIMDFCRLGLLEEVTGQKRNRVFFFAKYYNLFLDPVAGEEGE